MYEMNPWMVWQIYDEQYYLCDLRDESFFLLDKLSSEILSGLLNGNSVCEVANFMAGKYAIDIDEAYSDANDFAEELKNSAIVKEVEKR